MPLNLLAAMQAPTPLPQWAYEDDWVAANAEALLAAAAPGAPWFLQVSFPGPHPPFVVTAGMAARVPPNASARFPAPADSTQPRALADAVRRDYAAELENLEGELEMPLEIRGIDDADDEIGGGAVLVFSSQNLTRDPLVGRTTLEAEGAGQIDQLEATSMRGEKFARLHLDGDAAVVAHFFGAAAERVEERRFPSVGISGQGDRFRLWLHQFDPLRRRARGSP
jgi:hypothetical protein